MHVRIFPHILLKTFNLHFLKIYAATRVLRYITAIKITKLIY